MVEAKRAVGGSGAGEGGQPAAPRVGRFIHRQTLNPKPLTLKFKPYTLIPTHRWSSSFRRSTSSPSLRCDPPAPQCRGQAAPVAAEMPALQDRPRNGKGGGLTGGGRAERRVRQLRALRVGRASRARWQSIGTGPSPEEPAPPSLEPAPSAVESFMNQKQPCALYSFRILLSTHIPPCRAVRAPRRKARAGFSYALPRPLRVQRYATGGPALPRAAARASVLASARPLSSQPNPSLSCGHNHQGGYCCQRCL